jgi:hypothetical protein
MAADDFTPAALPHANAVQETPYEDDKRTYLDDDKKDMGHGSANVEVTSADQDHLDAVLDMEKRIQDGTATREVSVVCGGRTRRATCCLTINPGSVGIRNQRQPRCSRQGLVNLR